MKRTKRLLMLVLVLAIVCAATYAVSRYEEKKEQIRASGEAILSLPADTITELEWSFSDGESFGFACTDGVWQYTSDPDFPVDQAKIGDILELFTRYTAAFVIEDVEDVSVYGLDAPSCTLRIQTQTEETTIHFGDLSKMDEQRYLELGDGNVYLAQVDASQQLYTQLSDVILHDTIPEFDAVQSIRFDGAGVGSIFQETDSVHSYAPEQDFYYTLRNGSTVPLDTAKVKSYLRTITGLSLQSYVTYNATEAELEAYGLDTPLLNVTISYTIDDADGNPQANSCIVSIGENRQERSDAEEDSSKTVTKYVRINNSSIIYELSENACTTLTAIGYDDLRHSEVYWGDFDDVQKIDITLEGQTHSLIYTARKSEGEDATDPVNVWYLGSEEVSISDIRDALTTLTAESFTAEEPTGKEELYLKLYLDNESFPSIQIVLYRYDGSSCLASIDDQPVCLVSRSSVMALVEAVQALVLNAPAEETVS